MKNKVSAIEETDDFAISISDRKSPEFKKTADAVCEHIRSLSLTAEQNNTLVELIIANLQVAERGSFKMGLKMGLNIGRGFTDEASEESM